jgi:Flp pilus assembly protein TadB
MLADRPHGRRLTAAEQMRLEELERQLREDDPDLAALLGGGVESAPRTIARPPRWALLAGAAVVAAVLVLLAAVVGGTGGALAVVATLVSAFAGWRMLRRRRGLRRPPGS